MEYIQTFVHLYQFGKINKEFQSGINSYFGQYENKRWALLYAYQIFAGLIVAITVMATMTAQWTAAKTSVHCLRFLPSVSLVFNSKIRRKIGQLSVRIS